VTGSQFHFGSIQTGVTLFGYKGFKEESQFHFGSIQTSVLKIANEQRRHMSQFHFGSIQTKNWFWDGYYIDKSLNSTLVQFKRSYWTN